MTLEMKIFIFFNILEATLFVLAISVFYSSMQVLLGFGLI